MDDLNITLLLKIASLAEAAEVSVRSAAGTAPSIVSQPTVFPEPVPPSLTQEALRARLAGATQEELVSIRVAFWIGRDRLRRPNLKALRQSALNDMEHAGAYLVTSTLLAPSLRRAVEMMAKL